MFWKKFVLAALIYLTAGAALLAQAQPIDMEGACDVYFSPHGGTEGALVKFIGTAQSTIRVLAYNFTSASIGAALVDAHRRGVDVQIVLDKSVPTEKNSQLPAMLSAGIPSYIDRKHKIAHNKTIVVDGAWIETGSFNFTDSAENSNGENALICKSANGAAEYSKNWELHKSHSEVEK